MYDASLETYYATAVKLTGGTAEFVTGVIYASEGTSTKGTAIEAADSVVIKGGFEKFAVWGYDKDKIFVGMENLDEMDSYKIAEKNHSDYYKLMKVYEIDSVETLNELCSTMYQYSSTAFSLKLTDDITLTQDLKPFLNGNTTFEIDLNGHDLDMDTYQFNVTTNSPNLMITDSSSGGSGTVTGTNATLFKTTYVHLNGGTVIVPEGVVAFGAQTYIHGGTLQIDGGTGTASKTIIDGGTIIVNSGKAVDMTGSAAVTMSAGTVTVKGGTGISSTNANGTVTITGGSITVASGAVGVHCDGTATITVTTTVYTKVPAAEEGGEATYTVKSTETTSTVTATPNVTVGEQTGDTDKSDGKWDYEEVFEAIDRVVTVGPITDGEKIYIFEDNSTGNSIENMNPITPEWNEDKVDIDNGTGVENLDNVNVAAKPEGFDVAYVGIGENTLFDADLVIKDAEGNEIKHSLGITSAGMEQFELSDVIMQKVDEKGDLVYNEDGTPVLLQQKVDEAGNPVYNEDGTPVYDGEGKAVQVGNIHTGYCVDLSTYTQDGWWYKIENLNDADYYSTDRNEENEYISDADHIRGIVQNGYWGTSSGTGSLTSMKEMLKQAQADGVFSEDINVDDLTEGEAQAATQMAIWKYGNHEGGEIYLTAKGDGDNTTDDEKTEALDRINALAAYLVTLYDKEEETEIITPDTFISDLDFVVEDKVEDHENNADADQTNDAYNVTLKFALVVTPDDEKDDLVVKVVDSNNEVIASARIAGEAQEGENKITAVDGVYTLTGLQLIENSNVTFDLKLEGTQYLKEGVYIYTSEMRDVTTKNDDGTETTEYDVTSQTFVGIAEGDKQIDVGAKFNLTFDVDEGTITRKRVSGSSWDHEKSGGGHHGDDDYGDDDDDDDDDDDFFGDDDDDDDDDDDGRTYGDDDDDDDDDGMVAGDGDENTADEEDDGLVAGDDDEIIAATSDSNHTVGAAGGMFAALAGMFMLRKRKED